MKKPYGFAFGALLVASVVFLSAQVGGFPSRPRFQTVLVGSGAAPTAVGDFTARGNVNTAVTTTVDNDSNGTANQSRFVATSGDGQIQMQSGGSGRTAALMTNGAIGAVGAIKTFSAMPLEFGTNNTLAATISTGQVFDFVNAPTVAGSPISAPTITCTTACDISALTTIGQRAVIANAATESKASVVVPAMSTHYNFTSPPAGDFFFEGCWNFDGADTTMGLEIEFGQASGTASATSLAFNSSVAATNSAGGGSWDVQLPVYTTINTTVNQVCISGFGDPGNTFGLLYSQNTSDVDVIQITGGRGYLMITKIS